MYNFKFKTSLFLLSLSLSACSEALPKYRLEEEFARSLERSEKVAEQAQQYREEIKQLAAENERLIEASRELTLRAEAAKQSCEQGYRRAKVTQAAREKKMRAERLARARAAARVKAEAEQKAQEPAPSKEPEYSPSDAPLN